MFAARTLETALLPVLVEGVNALLFDDDAAVDCAEDVIGGDAAAFGVEVDELLVCCDENMLAMLSVSADAASLVCKETRNILITCHFPPLSPLFSLLP